jgi:predicted methyltransferase
MKYVVCATALLASCIAASTGFAASAGATHIPKYIRAAVDDSTRPEKDRARDADRKPELVLTFAGIKPGQKVGELLPGGGYYTRLLCRVVGSSGQVYAISLTMTRPMRMPEPPSGPNPCNNITASTMSASDLMLPSDLDVVWTTENYHDLHNDLFGKPDMKAFDTAVFNALKPGGVFIVEDHIAPAGSGASDTDTLHRIDPALVRQEVESAGFKYIGQSRALHNPDDPHTAKVFTMVDKTDRFLFKFQKPAS